MIERKRRGPITARRLMAELEADPEFQRRRTERDAAHVVRLRDSASDFAFVRRALESAGIASDDFGRFTSNRHPDVIRPSVFDYEAAVPVLLAVLPLIRDPRAKEAVVRSLTDSRARPVAVDALIAEFRNTDASRNQGLKWAIGNALNTVTTPQHVDVLLELAMDTSHGIGRQMIVDRLARISKEPRVVEALRKLATDEDVAFHAMAGLRRRLGPTVAAEAIWPLTQHSSERVRDAARRQLKLAQRTKRREK